MSRKNIFLLENGVNLVAPDYIKNFRKSDLFEEITLHI